MNEYCYTRPRATEAGSCAAEWKKDTIGVMKIRLVAMRNVGRYLVRWISGWRYTSSKGPLFTQQRRAFPCTSVVKHDYSPLINQVLGSVAR
ncbi:hypothetical protein FRC02_005856 [Tulasnella sp. 418]|nr:hypothetical protein FRC02_005856 [Tulasnella sp. 418]